METYPVNRCCSRNAGALFLETEQEACIPFCEGRDVGPTEEVIFGVDSKGRREIHRQESGEEESIVTQSSEPGTLEVFKEQQVLGEAADRPGEGISSAVCRPYSMSVCSYQYIGYFT